MMSEEALAEMEAAVAGVGADKFSRKFLPLTREDSLRYVECRSRRTEEATGRCRRRRWQGRRPLLRPPALRNTAKYFHDPLHEQLSDTITPAVADLKKPSGVMSEEALAEKEAAVAGTHADAVAARASSAREVSPSGRSLAVPSSRTSLDGGIVGSGRSLAGAKHQVRNPPTHPHTYVPTQYPRTNVPSTAARQPINKPQCCCSEGQSCSCTFVNGVN